MTPRTDVAIIGSGIVGNLAAAYLRTHLPDLDVTVVGRRDRRRPIVGESLIEASSSLMREIGLGPSLVEKQYPKYGLTYYYKANAAEPADPRYFVDEPPAGPPVPAYQLNRATFDEDLIARGAELGVHAVHADAVDVTRREGGGHTLSTRDADGCEATLDARWIVDASGQASMVRRRRA